jgi:glycosyltransferase involved in cell wall biosynthesis
VPEEKNMNIAIVTRYKNFPGCGSGGAETVQNMLKAIFEEAGHRVDVWGIDDAEHLGLSINPLLRLIIGECYITMRVFNEAVKIKRYDLVIASGVYGFGIHHRPSINLFHFSSFGYSHNYPGKVQGIKKKLAFFRGIILEYLSSRGKFVVSVSDYLKSFLEKGGIRVNAVINNCVNTDKFKKDPSAAKNGRCLFIGRYDYYGKGIDLLEKLARKGVSIDCITDNEIDENLGYLGTVKNYELVKLYNQYSIVLLPSRFESFGLVPLEAMSCGTPVIMSDVGIGTHLKAFVPEFVIEGWDNNAVDEYKKRIDLIMSNYEEYSLKSINYADKHYSYTKFRSEWLDLIKSLLKGEY